MVLHYIFGNYYPNPKIDSYPKTEIFFFKYKYLILHDRSYRNILGTIEIHTHIQKYITNEHVFIS